MNRIRKLLRCTSVMLYYLLVTKNMICREHRLSVCLSLCRSEYIRVNESKFGYDRALVRRKRLRGGGKAVVIHIIDNGFGTRERNIANQYRIKVMFLMRKHAM